MARTKLTSPQLNPSRTTDANGWYIYDFGTWKQYRKRVTFSQAFTGGSLVSVSLSSNNLPSGKSSISNMFMDATIVVGGYAGDFRAYPEMGTGATALGFTANPHATRTYSGFIDVVLTEYA